MPQEVIFYPVSKKITADCVIDESDAKAWEATLVRIAAELSEQKPRDADSNASYKAENLDYYVRLMKPNSQSKSMPCSKAKQNAERLNDEGGSGIFLSREAIEAYLKGGKKLDISAYETIDIQVIKKVEIKSQTIDSPKEEWPPEEEELGSNPFKTGGNGAEHPKITQARHLNQIQQPANLVITPPASRKLGPDAVRAGNKVITPDGTEQP